MLGPNVPVYGSPCCGYTAHQLVSMVYQEDPELKICTQKPTGVQTFASFIVDLKCVNVKDLAADDNGTWVTSTPRRKYELKQKHGVICSVKYISKVTPEVRDVITICRQHQGTP